MINENPPACQTLGPHQICPRCWKNPCICGFSSDTRVSSQADTKGLELVTPTVSSSGGPLKGTQDDVHKRTKEQGCL